MARLRLGPNDGEEPPNATLECVDGAKTSYLSTLSAILTFCPVQCKEPWRDAAVYLDAKAHPDDLLLFTSGFLLETNFNYYSKRDNLNKEPFPTLKNLIRLKLGKPYDYQAELQRISQEHDRIWLIFSHAYRFKKHMINTLSKTHEVKDRQQYFRRAHLRQTSSLSIEVMYFAKRLQDRAYGMTTITSP